MLTGHPADPASQSQTADPRGRVDSHRHSETEFLGLVIDVAQRRPRARRYGAIVWVYGYRTQGREIDGQAVSMADGSSPVLDTESGGVEIYDPTITPLILAITVAVDALSHDRG